MPGTPITARQIKAARTMLDWSQKDLAHKTGLSVPTIQRMERLGTEHISHGNVLKVYSTFEEHGLKVIVEGHGENAGVQYIEPSWLLFVKDDPSP